jgi:serine/threonine-protein kinase
VYRAFDPTVGRTVAIKVMLGDGASWIPNFSAAPHMKANATGGLRHKNIITVYDYGEHEGMPYLVIEYLEGRDLQKS